METSKLTDNELIAEFMGIHVAMHGPVLYYSDEDGYIDFSGGAEPYWPDKCWNDLMPVVEKIKLQFQNFYIKDVRKDIELIRRYNRVLSLSIFSTIDEVYFEVIEFIKWYNQQTI